MKFRNRYAPSSRSTKKMSARTATAFCAAAGIVVLFPGTAHAYLDPGTGSMLLSAAIGIAATIFFTAKTFYYKAVGFFFRLKGNAAPANTRNAVVFYSEGKQYWNTFKPVLEAMDKEGENAVYLTSGEDDPGLSHNFSHVTARFIGSGNRAFATLNMLEAAVCVMTTPGLDVLQIRRSPGVAHYAHLVHSPTDAALYKLYSFDYYDSVMCSGPHQMKSIRALEELRGAKKKILLETGCPYMDVLADETERATKRDAPLNAEKPRVLLAPTWGNNGLLRRFGLDLLLPMAEAGFSLVIRPHPQSRISEPDLQASIARNLADYPNVRWDETTTPIPAMLDSDVLVSDFSGIVFDYAFILERPVVTVAMEMDTRGTEAGDLPHPAWELTQLPALGATIRPDRIRDLPQVIASLPPRDVFAPRMAELRSASVYNFRSSGQKAAEQIAQLRRQTVSTRTA